MDEMWPALDRDPITLARHHVMQKPVSCVTQKQDLGFFSLSHKKEASPLSVCQISLEAIQSTQTRLSWANASQAYFWYDNDKDRKICFCVPQLMDKVQALGKPQLSGDHKIAKSECLLEGMNK